MKKLILLGTVLMSFNLTFGQVNDSAFADKISTIEKKIQQLNSDQKSLRTENQSLKNTIGVLNDSIHGINGEIKALKSETSLNSQNITAISEDLGTKISTNKEQTEEKLSTLDKDLSSSKLYWIIGILSILIIALLVFIILGKRIKSNKVDVESQISKTKKSLEEEALKLDNKLIEVLESQLKVQQEESKSTVSSVSEKVDHSLALKVADEIVRMQKNISRMDGDVKGLKPLEKGIERIQANFASNGYEMVNLLNVEYDERMNIDPVNFIVDESLPVGKKIITKIIKPQVNFNGVLIQRAQVEISQN